MRVEVITAQCGLHRKLYGMRAQEDRPGRWLFTWAFPLRAESAAREGYLETEIVGGMALDARWPGCPHCRKSSFFKCLRCGGITCYDPAAMSSECSWCGSKGGRPEETLDRMRSRGDA
jgi:hypothetical protein